MIITDIRMERAGERVSLFVTEVTTRRTTLSVATLGGPDVSYDTGEAVSEERCVAKGTWEEVKPVYESYMRVKDLQR